MRVVFTCAITTAITTNACFCDRSANQHAQPITMAALRRQALLHIRRLAPRGMVNMPRRSLADKASPPSPPLSSAPSPLGRSTVSTGYNGTVPLPQDTPSKILKLRDGRSGGFYLSLVAGAILSTPIISYFYWEHRKAHMKAKKEAILHELQARAKAQG